jgi:hypothetical protein
MKPTIASLIVAGFALSANPHGVISAQPVRHQTAGIDILVNGVPQRHYAHKGRWYVEAIKGKEYAIRMRNPYPVRVAVALSVDGLNTIDARHTTAADARKWVIEPFQTVTISGWQVNSAEARRFEFTTEARSYGQALGHIANLGTISAVFFKERATVIARESSRDHDARPAPGVPAAPPAASAEAGASAGASADASALAQFNSKALDEYAATGMGQRTNHAVTQVWLDLEGTPADTVNIRYEFRPQLIKLGILLATPIADPLERRGRARGFEGGYSPEVGVSPQRR